MTNRNRTNPVQFYLSDDEQYILNTKFKASGMKSMSAIRTKPMNKSMFRLMRVRPKLRQLTLNIRLTIAGKTVPTKPIIWYRLLLRARSVMRKHTASATWVIICTKNTIFLSSFPAVNVEKNKRLRNQRGNFWRRCCEIYLFPTSGQGAFCSWQY